MKKFRFKNPSHPGADDGTPMIAENFNRILDRLDKAEANNSFCIYIIILMAVCDFIVAVCNRLNV